MGVIKLMYHHISDDIQDRMVINISTFREQMELISKLELPSLLTNDILQGKNNGVMITFDDGYKSTVEKALPILQENGMRAIMAVCADYFIPEVLLEPTMHISQDFCKIPELRQWLNAGNELSAHTLSHPKLTTISLEEAKYEILQSKYKIEQNLNYKPVAFTYPFGSNNYQIRKIVSEEFKVAYATTDGDNNDMFDLKRIEINPQISISELKKIIEDNVKVI